VDEMQSEDAGWAGLCREKIGLKTAIFKVCVTNASQL